MVDEQLMRDYINTVKSEKRRRATAGLGKVLKACGRAIPKGIRHPDSMITNMHLYSPNRRGKTKLR